MKSKDQQLLEEAYNDVKKNGSYYRKLNDLAIEIEVDTDTIEHVLKVVADYATSIHRDPRNFTPTDINTIMYDTGVPTDKIEEILTCWRNSHQDEDQEEKRKKKNERSKRLMIRSQ